MNCEANSLANIPLPEDDIFHRRGDFTVARVRNKIDLLKIYALRYQVIINELGWLPTNAQGLEYDSYDKYSKHFAVYVGDEPIAYVRIIQGNSLRDYMLGQEFVSLIKGQYQGVEDQIWNRKHQSVEISRILVREDWRHKTREILDLLYVAMVQWAVPRDSIYWYLVVDEFFYKSLLKRHFIIDLISKGSVLKGGPRCIAGCLDLIKTRASLHQHDIAIHDLFFCRRG